MFLRGAFTLVSVSGCYENFPLLPQALFTLQVSHPLRGEAPLLLVLPQMILWAQLTSPKHKETGWRSLLSLHAKYSDICTFKLGPCSLYCTFTFEMVG